MGQIHSKLCRSFDASLGTEQWDRSTASSAPRFIENRAMGESNSMLCSYFLASLRTDQWDIASVCSVALSMLY